MKRCPACDKTFDDGMKFCQTDGTLLVDDTTPADPYKTVVGNQSDIAAAIPPLDPFKTMVAPPAKRQEEDDVLQLPQEPDSMKTMIVSQDELREELKLNDADDMLSLNSPPAPFGGAAAAVPIIEPKAGTSGDFPPAPPKPSDASSTDATAVMDLKSSSGNLSSPFDSKPFQNDFSTQSPYGNQENKPIPSPFQDSLPPGYQPPAASPFDQPKPSMSKEVDAPYSSGYQEPADPSPFQPPSPFGQADSYSAPMQQAEWTPPPAPVSEWQNQEMGANTPFQPPVAGGGQDQTLAIVSLVSGIAGILCCQILAPVAIVTGYLAKKKADENPQQFGGSGLALAGMITGGIGMLLLVLVIIYYIIVIAAVAVS